MTIRRELIDELLKEYPTSRHDRIKGLGNRSPPQRRSVPSSQDAGNKVIALPSWVGCTMTTAELPETGPRVREDSWKTKSIQLECHS